MEDFESSAISVLSSRFSLIRPMPKRQRLRKFLHEVDLKEIPPTHSNVKKPIIRKSPGDLFLFGTKENSNILKNSFRSTFFLTKEDKPSNFLDLETLKIPNTNTLFYNWIISFFLFPHKEITDSTPEFLRGHTSDDVFISPAYFEFRKLALSSPTKLEINPHDERILLNSYAVVKKTETDAQKKSHFHFQPASVFFKSVFKIYLSVIENDEFLKLIKTYLKQGVDIDLASSLFPTSQEIKKNHLSLFLSCDSHSLKIDRNSVKNACIHFKNIHHLFTIFIACYLLNTPDWILS